MASTDSKNVGIGVIIVTYRASDFIADCLESLLACGYPGMKIVVADNASPDATPEAVRNWAISETPSLRRDWPFGPDHLATRPIDLVELPPEERGGNRLGQVTLAHMGGNIGYAGAINRALELLKADPEIDLFWILNPDTVVEAKTPFAIAQCAKEAGKFAVIGGRIVFFENPARIQLDGGRIGRLCARVTSVNFNLPAISTPLPDPADLAFISGANMVASRDFLDRAGPMDEGYFLYFEEIDWQLRRGSLPLLIAPDAIVRHRAGITIGSGGTGKPSPFSVWFTHRSLVRFVARWYPLKLPLAYAFAWIRMLRNLDGSLAQALAFIAGIHLLRPPSAVRGVLPEMDWRRILSSNTPLS